MLSFIPSSLLLGVTSFVGTDLASVPLLWVIPLALYLLTFVIVFGRAMSDRAAGRWLAGGLIVVVVLLTGGRLLGVQIPAWVSVPGHFGGFVAIAMGSHGALAGRRPAAGRLTEFYLCMSIGGAAGGVLNALVAPLVFNSTYEYELGLVAAAFVVLLVRRRSAGGVVLDLVMAGLLTAGFLLASIKLKTLAEWAPWAGLAVAGLGAALFATFARRPLRLALAVTLALGAGLFARNVIGVVHEERSFFGVHRIRMLDDGAYRALIHGDIIHGVQSTDPARQRETSTYYVAEGPVGQVFKALPPVKRVGVIGLGTGGMACFARPGEAWIFFEIDAAVARLARDTRYFSYLAACGDPPVVLGDGRITVAAEAGFDVLVLDAFSSDAIPVHLLTREAFALYLSKLNPGGRLLVHISNKYMRLAPVVAAGAAANGAVAVTQFHRPDAAAVARWATASEWVVVARTAGDLAFIAGDKRWLELVPPAGFAAWTDEASNILGVLKW